MYVHWMILLISAVPFIYAMHTDYYLGFIQNYTPSESAHLSVVLISSDAEAVTYYIEAPGVGFYYNGTIGPYGSTNVTLPNSLEVSEMNVQDKGAHLITSSNKVNVIGQNVIHGSSDSFFAIPTTILCIAEYEYYGISVPPGRAVGYEVTSAILLVGTENLTMIEVTAVQVTDIIISNTNRRHINVGETQSLVINRLQTVYIRSHEDLSGTRIVTDKPISVFSGHECANVPSDVTFCDIIVEQIPPTTLWGRVFYVAPLATRSSYTLKILAAFNSTDIQIYCNGSVESHFLNSPMFVNKIVTGQQYCAIHSSKRVLVAMFGHGQDDDEGHGDPLMMLVPAEVQYTSYHTVSTTSNLPPLDNSFTHYVNIIVLTQYYQPSMIYLMSDGVNRSLDTQTWVPIIVSSTSEAFATQLNVSEGIIELFHINKSALMTTVVYGLTTHNSYGHPGGIDFTRSRSDELESVDLVFVLDTSGSIGADNFQLVREFVRTVSRALNIGPTRSQVAVILYSNSAMLYFNLTVHDNPAALNDAIVSIPYLGGGTNTAGALNLLQSSYFNGSLGIRDGHTHFAIVFTDGQSADTVATIDAANSLHSNTDFQVYSVGVSGAQNAELMAIAIETSNLFSASSFTVDIFQNFSDSIIQDIERRSSRLCFQLDILMDVEVFPGENAIFSCNAAIFTSELTYQWMRLYTNGNRDVVHDTDDGIVLSGNMLVIENVNYSNDGTAYCCKSFGFRSSELSYLNVSLPVIVAVPPNPILLQVNDSTLLSCEAAGGPRLVITWMKGEQVLSTGNIGDTVLQFLIPSATYEDENNYTCVAVIDGVQVSSSTSVIVSPTLISTPLSKTVVEGYSAVFTCQLQTVNPAGINFMWAFDNITLNDGPTEEYQMETCSVNPNTVEYNLTILNVDPSDAGVYSCVAENAAGSDRASGTLSVFVCPQGMVYEECGQHSTCLMFNVTAPRSVECTTGCFCEDDKVYYNESCALPNICECEIGILDLIFIIDNSQNTGLQNFQLVKDFLLNTTSPLSIGPTRSQVSVITYAGEASLNFNLNEHRQRESLSQAVTNLPYGTENAGDVASALNLFYSSYTDGSLGTRALSDHVAILLTAGLPDNLTSVRAITDVLHAETDIELYVVVTTGTAPVDAEYMEITSDPENLFSVANFSEAAFQRTTELIVQNFDGNLPRLCNVLSISSDTSAYPGENARFYCNASSGSVEQFYQWVRVEVDGETTPLNDDMFGSGSGVDYSNTLTVYNTSFSDDGVGYYCTSDNFSNSEVAYLNVLIPSVNLLSPTLILLQAHNSTTLMCEAFGGPRLVIKWFRENEMAMLGQTGEISLTYNIQSANVNDDGNYMCVAVIDGIQVNSTNINVIVSPLTLFQQVNNTVIIGDTATLECQTTSAVYTSVSWRFNGDDLLLSSDKYRINSTPISTTLTQEVLVIFNVTLSDVGVYTCEATNEAGSSASDGTLTVLVPPAIFNTSNRVITDIWSESVIIHCTANGLPMSDIIWMTSDGEEITGSDRVNITHETSKNNNGVFETSSSLKIFYPSNSDAGAYYCQADNGISIAVNKTIVLLVLGIVNVINFNGYQVEPSAIINSFPPNTDGSGSGYGAELLLECSTRSNETARWEILNSTSDANSVTIINITNSLSNLMVQIIEGEVTVRCSSLEYGDFESVDVTITTENPYVRLVSNSMISATLGTRQQLEFVIAIDSDGSKIGQSAISDSLTFSFTNSSQITVNIPEPTELDIFQRYVYMLPPVDTTLEGMYSVILGNMTVANAVVMLTDEVPTLTIHSSSNTTLEGQPLTLNCSTSQDGVVVKWLFNGTEISLDDERYMFGPDGLNTMITIINPNVSESGDYSCVIDINSDTDIGDDTVITIFPACEADFAVGILWGAIKRGGTATHRCSRLHPNFRDGVQIRRSCMEDGRWGLVNTIDCTMFTDAQPLIILSLILQPNSNDTYDQEYSVQLSRNLTSYLVEINENMRNPRTDIKTSRNQDTAIHMSFEVDIQLSESVVSDTKALVLSYLSDDATYSLEVQGFQPSNSCSCITSDGESSVKLVCIGAGVPPCVCSDGRCKCNSPNFAGNSVFCGKNSDGDNFPDVQLPCDDPTCHKDLCPELFSDSPSSGCPEEVSGGCVEDRDSVWKILWPGTATNMFAKQKCPGGVESIGFATRFCDNQIWDDSTLNVSQCQSVEVVNIIREVQALDNNASFTELVDITSRLSDVLNSSTTPILPMDLQSSNEILNRILNVAIDSNNDDKQLQNISTDIVEVIDVILDERNDASFRAAEKNESSVVLGTTERVASTLAGTHGNLSNGSLSIERKNLFVEVQTPLEGDKDIIFPGDNVTSLFKGIEVVIPRNALFKEGKAATVVNFIATTLGPLLQRSQNSTMKAIDSSVVSSQISSSLPKDEAVFLTFKISKQNISNPDAGCYFWNFTESEWSNAGIVVNGTNDTYIQCASSHLTSFAVLVASGEDDTVEGTALSIVSYIGCGISIVCLLLTLSAIVIYRKQVFNQAQHYIHFNLSLSLLLGLLVFISGIETAVHSDGGCLVVALLLHYLFLAAFSWMLCEGILIFLLLYFVFYKGFFKEWKFFTCLGWGLPLPIVIISVAVSHKQYGTNRACWLSPTNGAIWAFITPMILIIMVNVFFMGMTLRRILLTKCNKLSAEKISNLDVASSLVKAAFVLLPLLGATWIFGIFAVNEETVVFAWLFTMFNSLQGLFIFLFYVLRNEKFREHIMARRADISKLFTSTGGDFTLKSGTLPKETMSNSTQGQPNEDELTEKYNKVIRNEYVVSSTNLAPEYYQEHRTCVPNPFNMANTVDDFSFDEHDTIKSHRQRLSTKGIIKPSDYLDKNRQAVVYTNKSEKDEDTTTL